MTLPVAFARWPAYNFDMKISPRTGGLIFLCIMVTVITAMAADDTGILPYVSIPLALIAVASAVFDLVKGKKNRG